MMEKLKHLFGLRKVKSIIALVICFIMWQPFRLVFPELEVYPKYAFFYAIIEMRNSLATEKRTSLSRIKANIVGFAIAFIAIALRNLLWQVPFIEKYQVIFELLIILIGVFASLNIAEAVKCTTLCAIAAITFIICFWHTEYNPYFYAALRFVQTLMGVGIAYAVNRFLFKPEEP